jgi:hypothetical protein
VTVVESYPVYLPHGLASRRTGWKEWNIAKIINDAARNMANGLEGVRPTAMPFAYMILDCDYDVIFAALDEYDPARPEIQAVRAAFDALDTVRCGRCGVEHAFRSIHRCTAAAVRKSERATAALYKEMKKIFPS